MMIDQKLENIERIIAVNIERAIEELDGARSCLDQILQIGLHPLLVEKADSRLRTGQAELAVERTAAARLEINDALPELGPIRFERYGDGI